MNAGPPHSPLHTPATPRMPRACRLRRILRHHQVGSVNAPPRPQGSIEESFVLLYHHTAIISHHNVYDPPLHTIYVFSFPRTPFRLCPPPKAIISAAKPSGWSGCRPGEKFHPDGLLLNTSRNLGQSVRVVWVESNILHICAHAVISNSDFIFPFYIKIPGPPGHNK